MRRIILATAAVFSLSLGIAHADVIYTFDASAFTGSSSAPSMSLEITDEAYLSGLVSYHQSPARALEPPTGSGVVAYQFVGDSLSDPFAHFGLLDLVIGGDGRVGSGDLLYAGDSTSIMIGGTDAQWFGYWATDSGFCNQGGGSCTVSGLWSAPVFTDTLAQVPEPSSLVLFLGMLIAFWAGLRTRRRRPSINVA